MGDTDKHRFMDVAVDGDDLDELHRRKRSSEPGIEYDEQGNPVRVTKRGLAPEEVLSRLLNDGHFTLDERAPPAAAHKKVANNPAGLKKGYDPYESGVLAGKQPRKKRDLRALSEWIKAKKRAESDES